LRAEESKAELQRLGDESLEGSWRNIDRKERNSQERAKMLSHFKEQIIKEEYDV